VSGVGPDDPPASVEGRDAEYAAVTLQLAKWTSERPYNTTHVKAEDPEGDCLNVVQRRNVKGNGSSRGGQGADKQAVE
jgi:hypothetical protein